MLNNEFYSHDFAPDTDEQSKLFEDFKKLRTVFGTPHPITYMRSLVKTRKYVRTVYPPNWKAA